MDTRAPDVPVSRARNDLEADPEWATDAGRISSLGASPSRLIQDNRQQGGIIMTGIEPAGRRGRAAFRTVITALGIVGGLTLVLTACGGDDGPHRGAFLLACGRRTTE
ncbi:hypothetical protein GCM10020295_66720 [Streptomyces cinereospinus]